MKTAEQMRGIAKNKNEQPIITILNRIEREAKKGSTEMWWYANISTECREKLTELGFSVGETQFDRNEVLILIKW